MILRRDLPASVAVFLVAVPLCLGIALASGAPLMSGLIAGMVGGLIVGPLSGSNTSVSGPAAGLVAIVLTAIADLGSFEVFLAAVVISGLIQLALGIVRAGGIGYYFPSAVIRGLLVAIGLILILKQIPHAVGYDADPEGEFSFFQPDSETTFSELLNIWPALQPAAVVIAICCLVTLVFWERIASLKKSPIPGPLVAVVLGTLLNEAFRVTVPQWFLGATHRVSIPVLDGIGGLAAMTTFPDWSAVGNPQLYLVALTLAVVASLETLLNLEAADKIDPQKRVSPPNRELIAQGIGNTASGLLGGLPVTAVIVRSSVNIYSGAQTKASAIMHGGWLTATVLLVPGLLNRIPLSALAAILLVTGFKLANPYVVQAMWRRGMSQFVPFVATVTAIVFTDLLIGILIGLAIGIGFVLRNLLHTPFLSRQHQHAPKDLVRLKLAQQVTFLHRARFLKTLERLPEGSEVVLDATSSEYIDQDILEILYEFRDVKAPAKDICLSLVGFRDEYKLPDQLRYVDVVTRERQEQLTPDEALQQLKEGNERFRCGQLWERDFPHQVTQTRETQHPVAAVLACIDSRTPTELVFDQGLGDIFSVRVAGNVVNEDVLGSLEYAAQVAGVKLIVVLGHTGCGAVTAACKDQKLGHVTALLKKIRPSVERVQGQVDGHGVVSGELVDKVVQANVEDVLKQIPEQSPLLADLIQTERVKLVGAMYDLHTGCVTFFDDRDDVQHVLAGSEVSA